MLRRKLYGSENPNPIDIELGKRLRKLRNDRKISQKKLSQSLSVSFQQIQKYEKGANRLSVSMLLQISSFFKVPASHFTNGIVDHHDRNNDSDIDITTENEGFLIGYFRLISSEDLKEVMIEVVKVLAKLEKRGRSFNSPRRNPILRVGKKRSPRNYSSP